MRGSCLFSLIRRTRQQALAQAQLALEQAQLSAAGDRSGCDHDAVTARGRRYDRGAVSGECLHLAHKRLSGGFNNLGPTFVNLQTVMVGLQDFVEGNDINKSQNDPDAFVSLMPDYLRAGVLPYDTNLQAEYVMRYGRNINRTLLIIMRQAQLQVPQTLDALFTETYNTAETISATVKAGKDFFNYIVTNYPSGGDNTQPLPAITTTLANRISPLIRPQ